MAALGIKSLHLAPRSDGDLVSSDPTGVGGALTSPSVPVLGTPFATGATTVDVPLFTASTGPSTPITYALEVSTSPASGFASAISPGDIFADDSTASVTGLTASTLYYFRCKAVGNDTAESAYSSVVSVTTAASSGDVTAPGAPGLPILSGIGSNAITVTWTAATDNVAVTGYEVLRGIGDGAGAPVGSGTVVATVSGLTYNDAGLATNQQYYYRVRAKDAADNAGSYTSRVFGTTSAAAVSYDLFDNFESASIDTTQWQVEKNGGANTYVQTSTDVFLSGGRSRKHVITRDGANDFRAEVRDSLGAFSVDFNVDCFYGFAIYLPADFADSDGRDIVSQWHMYEWLETTGISGTSPAFGIQVRNGNWEIIRRPNAGNPPTTGVQESYTTTIGAVAKGAWTRWVARCKWHWTNGQSQVWKNGVEVYNVNGGNCTNYDRAPYWKQGNYRVAFKTSAGEAGVSPRILYYDNVRAILDGTGSFVDVSP